MREEEGERTFPLPTICDRLSEKYLVLDAACGQAHSLVVCRDKSHTQTAPAQHSLSPGLVVFAMGMNSMGQCGLGHCRNVSRPTPVLLPPLPPPPSRDTEGAATPSNTMDASVAAHPQHHRIGLFSGPLANHSIVSLSLSATPFSSPLQGRLSLPAVDIPLLASAVATYTAQKTAPSLTHLRELIADSYSSLAVLNASFRYTKEAETDPKEAPEGLLGTLGTLSGGVVGAAIGLDLAAVRYAYSLVLSAGNEQVGV